MNGIIPKTSFSNGTQDDAVSSVIFGMNPADNKTEQNAKTDAGNQRVYKLGSLPTAPITAKLTAGEKYAISIARRRFTPEQLLSYLRSKLNDRVIITGDLRGEFASGRVTMRLGEKNKGETIYVKTLSVETSPGKINYFVWEIDFESSSETLKPRAGQSTRCTLDICGQIINKIFQSGKSIK